MEPRRPVCKIVLLGDSGVGKTSIVMRWASGTYQTDVPSTVGANHQRKTVTLANTDVDLYVWDTAGQEQFHALTPLYARSAAAAILVASTVDRASFQSIDHWIDLLDSSCEKRPPLILAVNKTDLPDTVLTRDEIDEQYSAKVSLIFYVSAKSGEFIDALFMQAADAAYQFTFPAGTRKNANELTPGSGDRACC
jgi:small GTP-binding protein